MKTTTTETEFKPGGSLKALLDQLYDIKFSKHTTLVVVLLSMIYTVYRTQHYLYAEFAVVSIVAWPTSIFIEALVLAAAAAMFAALRDAYIATLKACDAERSRVGIGLSGLALAAAFIGLLFVAWNDAYLITHQIIPTLIMTLAQFSQMLFIVGFISAADLDEREKLRTQYADYQTKVKTQKAQTEAGQCPYCFKVVRPNNRKRHMDSCPNRPAQP